MTQMVRKQIYLHRRQQLRLKRLARARGVSEAELIRQLLDEKFSGGAPTRASGDPSALQEILQAARGRRRLGITGPRTEWSREALYADRQAPTPMKPR
jgi:hypothetical protein